MEINKLIEVFEAHQDNNQKIKMEAYMRNQFPFLGIASPLRKQIEKPFLLKEPIDFESCIKLIHLNKREYFYFVLDYLKKNQKQLTINSIKQLEALIEYQPWWDTIDLFARIYGSILINQDKSIMLTYSKDNNLWKRRIALLFMLGYKEKFDDILFIHLLENNLNSQEFFINKAIGWILRDYSKYNPEFVYQILNNYSLSSLSIKEASKYLNRVEE